MSPSPPDCQGDADCIAAQQQCDDDFNAAVTDALTTAAQAESACNDTQVKELAECDQLPPAQQAACQSTVRAEFVACVQAAMAARDTSIQIAQTTKAFCFSQTSPAFLNSSRNGGQKKCPPPPPCPSPTAADCQNYTQPCRDLINAIDTLIKSQAQSGEPSDRAIIDQVDALIVGFESQQ